MSKHLWASPKIPAWYLYDQFPQWAERAMGTGWATKTLMIDSLRFYSANKMTPMAGKIDNKMICAGTVYNRIKQARDSGAESAAFCIDVTARDL